MEKICSCNKYSSQIFSLTDSFWEKCKEVIPTAPEKKGPGRPRMDDRKAMTAIYYIFYTGCQWKALPPYLGASSTVHDRLQLWVELGIFHELWKRALNYYDQKCGINWTWQAMDGCHIVAPLGGKDTGPSYKHRGKRGSNRSLLTDKNGIPLAIVLAPANVNDFKLAQVTFESLAIEKPDPNILEQHICLDKGYDYPEIDLIVMELKYIPHIRRKGEETLPDEMKTHKPKRWVVERTHAWLNNFRSVFIRWAKKPSNYLGFLHLAFAAITLRAAKIIAKLF